MNKRICSVLLALVMLLAILPLQAQAVNAGMSALDMQEISRTEYQISKDVKEYEWLLNNSELTKQMVGHVMEVKVGKTSTATLAAGYSDYNIENIQNGNWAMVTTTAQAQAMESRRHVNVVGAINGGGFDMSNGRPSGALVLNGTVIQSANSTTFWVDKDNTAHITSGAEYNQAVAAGTVSEAISSFGDILSDGKAHTGLDNSTRASRTAVGIKADGTVVLFMVDGRQSPYSAGMTMAELAAAMENLGCETAINLDGGGSSTFATQREGDVVSTVDPNGERAGLTLRCRPSDGYERRVSNTLMVLSNAAATDTFDHAALTPNNEIYTPGSTVTFQASGVDGGGFPIAVPDDAVWSVVEGASLGTINAQTGVFTANADAEGTVQVALTVAGKVAGTTQIQLHWPDKLGFTNNSVSLDFGKTSDMTFKPTYQGREVHYKDGDFIWSLDESEKISYKYTALVEEKGYGFSKKWSGGTPFKWTGPGLEQELTPWNVAPKIYMPLTGNVGAMQMIEWGAGDGCTYRTYFTEQSVSYQVGTDGTISVQELLTHDKAEKLATDIWEECTEEENAKLVNLEHTFTIGQFANNKFIADKSNSLRATAKVTLANNPSVVGSIELVVGLEPLVLFDFEAPADGSKTIAEYWNTLVEPGTDAGHEKHNGHGGQLSAEEIQNYRLWVRSGAGNASASYAGSGVVTGKENGVRFGAGAYKLAYDFTNVSTSGVIAADFGYSCDLLVNTQQPTKIGMWVNVPADRKNDDSLLKVISAGGAEEEQAGNGYNTLNADGSFTFKENLMPKGTTMYAQYYGSAVDGDGNPIVLRTLSDMAGRGWIWVEADISSMQMPIDLYRGYVVHLVSPQNAGKLTESDTTKKACKGYILIDNIQFIYGPNTNDVNNPAIESVTERTSNTVLYAGQEPELPSGSLNFEVTYSDSEATDKYASGIDTASTRVYIDGVDQTANAEINTGSLYLRNLTLRNGEHSLTVYLKDLYGNETSTTYYFQVVDPEGTEAGIAVVPQEAAPEIGKEFALYVVNVTNEDISSAELDLTFPASYLEGITIEPAAGYTATLTTPSAGRVHLSIAASPAASQAARTVQQYDHEMACLVLKIPESAASDSYFEYSIAQASYLTPSGKNTFVGSVQKVMLDAACYLQVDRTLLVGEPTKLLVTDRTGAPQTRASVYCGDTLLGKTGPDGTLKYTFTTAGLQTLYAVSSGGRSQNASAVVCAKPEIKDGAPFGVQNNAVQNASTTQSITWMSSIGSSEAKAVVRYAQDEALSNAAETAGTSEIRYFVADTTGNALRGNTARLTGLEPGTTYYYQVGDGSKWSETCQFTTADPTEETTSFFVLGDIQTDSTANLVSALNTLKTGSYAFGVQTGDMVDRPNVFSNWQSLFTVLDSASLNGVDMVHALGNHEYYGDADGELSGGVYDLPTSKPNGWYAVEYGNVCVVVINHRSEGAPNGGLTEATAEIAAQLKTNCAWKILVTHEPLYGTNGQHSEQERIAVGKNLEKAGIDFVFSGDDHSYARTYPMLRGAAQADDSRQGVVYYVSGDLSGKSNDFTKQDCHAHAIGHNDYSGLYLTVEATAAQMTVTAHNMLTGQVEETYSRTRTNCELGKHTYNASSLYSMADDTVTCALCSKAASAAATGYTGVLTTTDGNLVILTNGVLKKNEFTSLGEKSYHSCATGYAYETTHTDERTCIKGGRTIDTCPSCSAKNESQFLYPVGHDWDDDYVCRKCSFHGIDIASDAVVFKFGTPDNPITSSVPDFELTDVGVRPSSFAKYGDYTLTWSNDAGVGSDGVMKDLYVQWPSNKQVGAATIEYEGKGNYYGKKVLHYVIKPGSVKQLNAVDITETTAKLTWPAAPGVTYYEVFSCNEKNNQRRSLGTTTSCEYALNNLTPDATTYYVVAGRAKVAAENDKLYTSPQWSPVCAVSALPLSADVTAMAATVDGVQIPAVNVSGTNYLFLPASADLTDLNVSFTRSAAQGNLVVTGSRGSQTISDTASLDVSALTAETSGYWALTAKVGNGTPFAVRIMQASNLATVYLTSSDAGSQGRGYVDTDKKNTTAAGLRMIDAAGQEISAGSIKELKARGNSTFTYAEKKSYQMKLAEASDLLQTGENVKTWVLLANYFDATLMHDKLFKDMAAAMQMPYTASCGWVNLYYDGEYRGVYLLSEKNAVKSTGVGITDMEAEYEKLNEGYGTDMKTASSKNSYGMTYFYTTGLTEPDNLTGGYLLELNHSKPDEVSGFITRKGKGINVKSPEWCGDAAMQYISEYYQAFEDAVYATDDSGAYTGYNTATGKHYYDYVDRDSLVKIFLLQELALNPDGFVSSLYFYKDVDGKLYAGPIWDQDMTLGTGWTKQISPDITDYHYLAEALIQIPDFRAAVIRYYTQTFAPLAKSLTAENGAVSHYTSRLTDSAEMNFILWPYIRVGEPSNAGHIWQNATYNVVLADMQSWLTKRIAKLDATFAGTVFDLGDVNMDGMVNSYDAVLILRYVSGFKDRDFNIQYADIDASGTVNSYDAVLLLRRIVGIKD